MSIKVNLYPLKTVAAFTYLVCIIVYSNSYWATMYHNLGKARRRQGMVLKVLEKAGATVRTRVMMYKAVVQTVILYQRYSWVITEETMKVLEECHHRIDRSITEKTARLVAEKGWE